MRNGWNESDANYQYFKWNKLLLEQSRKKIKNLMPVSPQAVLGLPRRESKMEIHKEKST